MAAEQAPFEAPALDLTPQADAAPHVGAIDEAVTELHLEAPAPTAAEAESVIDRSPPPPVAPPKGKGAAAAPARPKLMPPPKSLRPRKNAPPPAATPAAEDPDASAASYLPLA